MAGGGLISHRRQQVDIAMPSALALVTAIESPVSACARRDTKENLATSKNVLTTALGMEGALTCSSIARKHQHFH